MNHISINMLPKGSKPVTGMRKLLRVYHGPSGIGRGNAFIRQGQSAFPPHWRPNIVPPRFKGKETNNQIAAIIITAELGKVCVPYARPTEFKLRITAATVAGTTLPVKINTLIQPGAGFG